MAHLLEIDWLRTVLEPTVRLDKQAETEPVLMVHQPNIDPARSLAKGLVDDMPVGHFDGRALLQGRVVFH